MVFSDIKSLISYGVSHGLLDPNDKVYALNKLCDTLNYYPSNEDLATQDSKDENNSERLSEILARLVNYARGRDLLPGEGVAACDLFDTKIMGCITPSPSVVIDKFSKLYNESPKRATDWFYRFSIDTNYIRQDRVERDLKWVTSTSYGNLDITINLSKPEKDPRDIALALKNPAKATYPKCAICRENEGFAGSPSQAARQNHRLIPWGEWFFQYSPYVYYNEHCIVLSKEHTPMKINRATFERIIKFVTDFPHYTLGSNADLPIVGGSILTHDHYQGGCYEFPMARAGIEEKKVIAGVEIFILKWPMSVLRLSGGDPQKIIDLAVKILNFWRLYSDESVGILSETSGVPHNTITPIARRRGALYELDLVLRNNRTSNEHPEGIFHPHRNLHHIKKENIGLIEVLGLAILPGRLKREMESLIEALILGQDPQKVDGLSSHADWAKSFPPLKGAAKEYAWSVIKEELGKVFLEVLNDCAVYKRNEEGRAAFLRFLEKIEAL